MTVEKSECLACAKEHEAHESEHAAMEQPISSIVDGWPLTNGDLYLVVKTGPGATAATRVPRYYSDGQRKTTR